MLTRDYTELCESLRHMAWGSDCGKGLFEAADLIESQVTRIQQQALEYVSLQAQCDEHLARIAELEKERDDLNTDAKRWQVVHRLMSAGELWDVGVIIAHESGIDVSTAYFKTAVELIDSAIQAEKETRS